MLERKEREGMHKGPRPIIQPFDIHVAAKTWITLNNLSIKKFASRFHKKRYNCKRLQIKGKGCFLPFVVSITTCRFIGQQTQKSNPGLLLRIILISLGIICITPGQIYREKRELKQWLKRENLVECRACIKDDFLPSFRK